MHLPCLLLGLQTEARQRRRELTSAVVATEATETVAATAGALKATVASVVSAKVSVCRRCCNTGSTLQLAALKDACTDTIVMLVEICRANLVLMKFFCICTLLFSPILKARTVQLF
jgi:hypothetical protein